MPVIAVFTKHDQFRRDIGQKLQDPSQYPDPKPLDTEVERIFHERYLTPLAGPPQFESPPFIRLESEELPSFRPRTILISILQKCINLTNGVMV